MTPAQRSGQPSSALLKTPAAATRPSPGLCEGCGGQVLRARTTAGVDVTVGAACLSPLGELAAVLEGVGTYTWHRIPNDLAHRYPLVIRSRPAGTPRQTVHALHRCGDTWPAVDPPGRRSSPTPDDDHPPY